MSRVIHFGPVDMCRVTVAAARLLALAALAAVAACAPFRPEAPTAPGAPSDLGTLAARTAMAQLGAPYRYGGSDPSGFDCSGLVAYAYGRLGIVLPRTAAQQFSVARPVPREQLRPGDLVFFRLVPGREVTHVGIYTGQGRFVHAPQTGRSVSEASLSDDFYSVHFAGSGRVVAGDSASGK